MNWDKLSIPCSKNREGKTMKGGGDVCGLYHTWRRKYIYLSVFCLFVCLFLPSI